MNTPGKRWLVISLAVSASFLGPGVPSALADKTKAVREAVEYVVKRFGPDLGEETAESLTAKLAEFGARHGDDAVVAFRKVGPRTIHLVEEAGEHAPEAVRLLAKYGDEAAWVVARPERLAVVLRHGDEAAEALIRHKDIVLPLIERYDATAARAFAAVSGRNARRLAMMDEAADLARIGRTDELLSVIGRYGDRAADFIWRHKGALAVSAVLAAFLAEPQPFIDGTRDLARIGGDVAKEPLREAARGTNWTAVTLFAACFAVALLALRYGSRRRIHATDVARLPRRRAQDGGLDGRF